MKNENKTNGAAPVTSQQKQDKEVSVIAVLQTIEKLLARGNGLSQAIIGKLHSIDDSITILAAQKKRELDPEEPQSATGQ